MLQPRFAVGAVVALLVASAASGQTVSTLHSFRGADGWLPVDELIQATDGKVYGTTWSGGSNGSGTIFSVTPAGAVTTLHSFSGPDGRGPIAGLVEGTDANFYGTTFDGGSATCGDPEGCGTIFRVTPAGVLTPLHLLAGSDGKNPHARLVRGGDGNFYGTASSGGAFGGGTAFRVSPSGSFAVLHSFSGSDGWSPWAGLVRAADGDFYGTTYFGGTWGFGTVFRLTPAGVLTTLHSFPPDDGRYPWAGLSEGSDGNFYGTTFEGGLTGTCNPPRGCGTIFRVGPSGSLTILHKFSGADGDRPMARPLEGADRNYYGTTGNGGTTAACDDPLGCGTVYRLTPASVLTTLHSFSGADGRGPEGLVEGADGSFYGVTPAGGLYGGGTIFRLVVPAQFEGFHDPVNPQALNQARAGQAIPLKWRLTTITGEAVRDPGSFAGLHSYEVACGGSARLAEAIEAFGPGRSGLQDLGDGFWRYNWKTETGWAGTCRATYVRFADGQVSPHVVFRFR